MSIWEKIIYIKKWDSRIWALKHLVAFVEDIVQSPRSEDNKLINETDLISSLFLGRHYIASCVNCKLKH